MKKLYKITLLVKLDSHELHQLEDETDDSYIQGVIEYLADEKESITDLKLEII